METKKTKLIFIALLSIISFFSKAQTLIQLVSITNNGAADTLGAFPIFKNSDSNIVFAGNERINAQQCNFKTLCSGTGTTSWSQSFNANIKKAYTTATKHTTGFIYVVGCTYIDSIRNQDLTVLKYTNGGTLVWTYYYNGTASLDDIATDITLDNSGNVYITGAAGGTSTNLADFVTIKLNSSGVNQWTKIYDYTNLIDIPMGIKYLPVSNKVVISGTSGSGFNNYDFATLQYNATNGNQTSVIRQSSSTAGLNKGVGMTTDASENVYFTGMTWNGTNFDLQVTKFDNSLNLLWSQTFNGHGFDDSGYSIAIDNANNIVVTGYSNTNALGTSKELVVLKYSSSGTLLWQFLHQPVKNNSVAEGIKVKINSNNDIYIGGNQRISSNQDIFLLKLTSSGKVRYNEIWNSSFNSTDIFYDLMLEGSYVFCSALSKTGTGIYNSMKIQYEERNVKPIFVNPTTTPYASNHLIIKFNPAIMNTANINNRKFLFGKLKDFVPDSTILKINAKLSSERYTCNSAEFNASKIFMDMTKADSLSTTRLGDVIKIPPFYSAILVEIPIVPTSYGLVQSSVKLNEIKPDIYYSELNYAIKLAGTPNDNLYYQQSSLHPTIYYTNAHINADSSWSLANGQPYVKVGVFDSGINSYHLDLTDINSNVNIGGYNFADHNAFIGSDNFNGGHGTPVTGIISAARNNGLGVAGIAGRNDSLNTQGVSVYDCRIVTQEVNGANYDSLSSFQTIAQAMLHSTRGDSSGFAINVMNHSFVFNYAQNSTYADTLFKSATLQDQINFASRNGVAIACSKGWFGTNYPLPGFPADWNPEIVSSVGGSGSDGHSCQFLNQNCYASTSTLTGLNTNWGVNMDFIAPAAPPTIETTDVFNAVSWAPFGGTSASAAHVSGAYGLMMSYFNHNVPHWDNLLHEDCENILKRTCTDLAATSSYSREAVGYDKYTGYGRINLNAAIKAINNQHYRFRHLALNHGATISTFPTLLHSSVSVKWPAYNNLAAGVYSTNVYKITTTLTYSLNATETIIDSWPMYKECFGWSSDTASILISIDKPYYSRVVSANNTTAVLETFVFQNLSNNTYYPNTLSNARSAITLYTYDTAPTLVGIKNNQEANRNFMLRPNPNSGEFYVFFGSELSSNITYSVYDVLGKEITKGTYKSQYGENNIPINIQQCANGIYIVNVSDESKVLYRQKVIKH